MTTKTRDGYDAKYEAERDAAAVNFGEWWQELARYFAGIAAGATPDPDMVHMMAGCYIDSLNEIAKYCEDTTGFDRAIRLMHRVACEETGYQQLGGR